MKLLFVFMITTLVTSCNNQDDGPIDTSISGTWQLVEVYDGGSLQPYRTVEDGSFITFKTDSTLTSTFHSLGCAIDQIEGSFETTKGEKSRELTMHLSCEDKQLAIAYYYGIDSEGHLVISPKEFSCGEGCSWKFKRIETPAPKD